MGRRKKIKVISAAFITAVSANCCFVTSLEFKKGQSEGDIFCMAIMTNNESTSYVATAVKNVVSAKPQVGPEGSPIEMLHTERGVIINEFVDAFTAKIDETNKREGHFSEDGRVFPNAREYGYPDNVKNIFALITKLINQFPTQFRMEEGTSIKTYTVDEALSLMRKYYKKEQEKR